MKNLTFPTDFHLFCGDLRDCEGYKQRRFASLANPDQPIFLAGRKRFLRHRRHHFIMDVFERLVGRFREVGVVCGGGYGREGVGPVLEEGFQGVEWSERFLEGQFGNESGGVGCHKDGGCQVACQVQASTRV